MQTHYWPHIAAIRGQSSTESRVNVYTKCKFPTSARCLIVWATWKMPCIMSSALMSPAQKKCKPAQSAAVSRQISEYVCETTELIARQQYNLKSQSTRVELTANTVFCQRSRNNLLEWAYSYRSVLMVAKAAQY